MASHKRRQVCSLRSPTAEPTSFSRLPAQGNPDPGLIRLFEHKGPELISFQDAGIGVMWIRFDQRLAQGWQLGCLFLSRRSLNSGRPQRCVRVHASYCAPHTLSKSLLCALEDKRAVSDVPDCAFDRLDSDMFACRWVHARHAPSVHFHNGTMKRHGYHDLLLFSVLYARVLPHPSLFVHHHISCKPRIILLGKTDTHLDIPCTESAKKERIRLLLGPLSLPSRLCKSRPTSPAWPRAVGGCPRYAGAQLG
jgi:hypothetical protein